MTRTFIAIDLNDEARGYLHQQIQRLASSLPRVRWVDPETLHLTLAFLGELDDAQLAQATQATLETARAVHPFTVRVGSLGMFGPAHNPRVIWVGLAGSLQPLLSLQARLAERLARDGFPPDERPYAPHLTLARIKAPLNSYERTMLGRAMASATPASSRSDQRPPDLPVAHLSVMKSDVTRAGPIYTRLHLCPFAAEA